MHQEMPAVGLFFFVIPLYSEIQCLPKKILFAKLNRKLVGYYNYYGVTGNFKSLNSFVYQVTELLFKCFNRPSQSKSYNREGFEELIKQFEIAKPRIYHALRELQNHYVQSEQF